MAERSIIWDLISNDRSSATNDRVANSFEKLDKKTSNLGATLGRVGTIAKIFGGAVATGGVLAVTAGVKTAASLETTRIGFTTLLGSAKKANDYINWMKQFAAATPFDLAGLTDSARKLIGVGVSAKQSKVILQDFGDTAGAVGMDAEHFNMAMLAVSQSISAGHIKLGDMNQLMNDGIPIWKLLSEAVGKPVAKIQDMISKGKLLTSDVLPKLLGVMHKDYGGAMAKQSRTLTGLWSTLMDTINLGTATALEPLEPLMKDALAGAADKFGKALGKIPGVVDRVRSSSKKLNLGAMFGKVGDIEKGFAAWAKPIVTGIKMGIQDGNWSDLGPIIKLKIDQAAKGAGSGAGSIFSSIGKWAAGTDWMMIGESVGKQAFPFAIGFINSLFDGVILAFKEHPIDTILGILSIIPMGRAAGLFSKGLKPGILKGLLDALAWVGKRMEGPILGFVKLIIRKTGEGFVRAAPELSAAVRSMIETGILKVLYRAEGVTKSTSRIFTLIAETPGRMVGKIVETMFKVGRMIVGGVVKGMESEAGSVINEAKNIAGAVPSEFEKLLHIKSPSVIMTIIGGHTMQGFINGIRGKKKEMLKALHDTKDDLTKEITKWNDIYDKHKQKLADLKSAYADLKNGIRDAFAGTSIVDRGGDLGSVLGSFSQDISKSKAANSALAKLKKMGLRQDLLTQLSQGGEGALGLEQSILAGGKGAISKLNSDQKQLIGQGNAAGARVANAQYAKAIASETKEVAKLRKVNEELTKALKDLNKALKSPGHVDAAKLRAALYKILKQGATLSGSNSKITGSFS